MSKFKVGDIVRHYSFGLYRITQSPNEAKLLEECRQTFYAYTQAEVANSVEWYRRADVFEDGRFIKVEQNEE